MNLLSKLVLTLLFMASTAKASDLAAKNEIYWAGQVIGYNTQDPNVEFIRPANWEILKQKTFIEKKSENLHELNMVFKPSYKESVEYMLQKKKAFPNKIFLPLPSRMENSELFMNEFLGNLGLQLVPTPINQSPFLYFKVIMSNDQLATLKKLAKTGLVFAGVTEYSYQFEDEIRSSSASINGFLDESELSLSRPESYGLEWLIQLFDGYDAVLENAVDGNYSLGFLSLTIADSILTLRIDSQSTQFVKVGNSVTISPKQTNTTGSIFLRIAEFDSEINLGLAFSLTGTLDLATAAVKISQLQIDRIEGQADEGNDFVLNAINKHLSSPTTLKQISTAIEEDLRSRILGGNLFLD